MFKTMIEKINNITVIKETDNTFIYLVKSLIIRSDEHNVTQTAGQLAYFAFLSIFPFIIFINSLISALKLSGNVVADVLSEIFPEEISQLIGMYIEYINGLGSGVGVISIGVIVALFSASKYLRSLSIGINLAYGITEKKYFLKRILSSVFLTVVLGGVIILSLMAVAIGREWIYRIIILVDVPISWLGIISVGKWLLIFFAYLTIITLIYYAIPLKKMKLLKVLPGAICAVAANFLLTYAYAIYIAYFSNFSILYGSVGAVLLLVLWLYFIGLFMIVGAEINSALEEKGKYLKK